MSAANGEGDDTAGISMPENSSVFPERPDIQYRICVDGIIGRVFVQRCSMRGGDRRSLLVMISFAVPSSSPTLKASSPVTMSLFDQGISGAMMTSIAVSPSMAKMTATASVESD